MVNYGQSLSRPDASMEPGQSDVPRGFTNDSHKDTAGYWQRGTDHDDSSPKLRQGMDARRHKDLVPCHYAAMPLVFLHEPLEPLNCMGFSRDWKRRPIMVMGEMSLR